MYVCMCAYVWMYGCVHVCICVLVCMCVCVNVYVCVDTIPLAHVSMDACEELPSEQHRLMNTHRSHYLLKPMFRHCDLVSPFRATAYEVGTCGT